MIDIKVLNYVNDKFNKNNYFDIAISGKTIYLLFKDNQYLFAKFYVGSVKRYMEENK